jgi:hypothetical protein
MTGKNMLAVAALLLSFGANSAPVTGVGGIPDPFPGDLPDPFPGTTPDPFPGNLPDPFPTGGAPDPLPGGGAPDPLPGMPTDKPELSGGSIWWLDLDGARSFVDGLGDGQADVGDAPFFAYVTGPDAPGTLDEHISYLTSNPGVIGRGSAAEIESVLSAVVIGVETAVTSTSVTTASTASYSLGASVVPVPAAVWLFGSALAGLGWLRRK